MNYVELHIGDYETATAHLTACEDGIYGRLLRRYYSTEAPLPLELKAVQRLVRARTRDEREAVQTVLDEFFQQSDDGWRHKRCDAEIARYNEKREKAQRSANARWNGSGRNANASPDAMRTHSDGNAHQSPVTSHQAKADSSHADSPKPAAPARQPTDAGRACLLMRQAGCPTTNPSHPHLLAALGEGVTPETLGDAAAEGVALGKSNPFTWAIATARSRHAEALKQPTGGTHATRSHSGRNGGQSLADRSAAVHEDRTAGRPEPAPGAVLEGTATRVAP